MLEAPAEAGVMSAEAGGDRKMKMVPAPIPAEIFALGYTVDRGGKTEKAVYVCLLDGCYVPEDGRKMHRTWHEDLARMIRDAVASS